MLISTYIGVHVENFSIPFVFKQDTFDALSNHLVVWCVVGSDLLVFPVIKAQISWLWQKLFLAGEVGLKVLGFEPMSVVNVSRYFLVFGVFVPYEDD